MLNKCSTELDSVYARYSYIMFKLGQYRVFTMFDPSELSL